MKLTHVLNVWVVLICKSMTILNNFSQIVNQPIEFLHNSVILCTSAHLVVIIQDFKEQLGIGYIALNFEHAKGPLNV